MKKRNYLKQIAALLAVILITPILIALVAITCYKKELTELLITQAKTTYGLNIKIEDTKISLFENWPNATIELTNVSACSNLCEKPFPPIFQAQSISVSFDLSKLLYKTFVVNSVSVHHGVISLLKDKEGNTNYKLIESAPATKKGNTVQLNLQKINLVDVTLQFKNEERDKHIGIVFKRNTIHVNGSGELINVNLNGNIKIEELLFKPAKGPFLKNTEAIVYLNTTIYRSHKSFFVDETSYAIIDEEKYSLVSFVQLKGEKKLTLKIKAPAADFKKGMRLMNRKIRQGLAKINVENPVSILATIIAPIGKTADPELYIQMSGKNNNILLGSTKIPFQHVSFTGYLRALGDKGTTASLSNGTLRFDLIKGQVYDFPFTAQVSIDDLKDPKIKIKAKINIAGASVKFKPGTDFILDGHCLANVDYTGDMVHLNSKEFLDAPQQLALNVQFKKFSYRTAPDQPVYVINGNAEGLNKDVAFKGLKLETVGGNFTIDGNAKDFVPYVFGQKNGFSANIQAFTNFMDLTPMIAKSFNDKNTGATVPKVSKQEVKEAMEGAFNFVIGMKAQKLVIRNLIAKDADAQLNYSNKTIEITKLHMKACNGELSATGRLHNFTNVQANLTIKNMEVKTMFEQFEDFGQKTISSKKLQGTISLTTTMKARLNEKFQLQAPDLEGEVQLKLKDGHLLDFEPLQNISPYFRNRDFKDISFSEINQTFKIKGTDMYIQNLEVASSVLNLYIDGIYSFNGQTNLNLRIPLSNLRKRDKAYSPKSLGEEGRSAKAVLLNAHGMPNKIKISWGTHSRDTLSLNE